MLDACSIFVNQPLIPRDHEGYLTRVQCFLWGGGGGDRGVPGSYSVRLSDFSEQKKVCPMFAPLNPGV